MPTYEYRCSHCAHTFEEFQSMKDNPLTTCPQCKEEKLYRVIGMGGGAIFKGSGFYQTDYKGGKPSATETNPGKKPESKPAENNAKPPSTEKKGT